MLVPRTQLLFWFALIVLPSTLLGAAFPGVGLPAALVTLAFVLLVLVDAVPGFNCLDGIRVDLPETVRLSKDHEGTIDIIITDEGTTTRRLRLGLPFPYEINSTQETLTVILQADVATSRCAWACTPRKRGRYRLGYCYLEGRSPLGFWVMRGQQPLESELRVYPDLSGERNNLAALFLNRGSFGIHAQRQVGKGRDFEKLKADMIESFKEAGFKVTFR